MAKSKRQKKPSLPENQTIKHYFRPVPDTNSAVEAKLNNTNASTTNTDMQTQAISRPAMGSHTQYQSDDSINTTSSYFDAIEEFDKLLRPASLATYQKDSSTLSKYICTLKHLVYSEENPRTSMLLQYSNDVCTIDNLIGLIEYETSYYLIHTSVVSEQVLYQCVLNRIGHFDAITLEPPISLYQCLSLEYPENQAHIIALGLYAKRGILTEHFKTDMAMEGDTVWLKSLPLIISNYAPTLDKIPLFLFGLYTKVNWGSEATCIESLVCEYASLYSCTTQHQWITLKNQTIATGRFKAPNYLTLEGFIEKIDIPFIMRDEV